MLVNMEILGAILNGHMFQALQDNQFGAPLFPNSYTSLSLPFSIFVFCTCFKWKYYFVKTFRFMVSPHKRMSKLFGTWKYTFEVLEKKRDYQGLEATGPFLINDNYINTIF